MEDLLPLIVGSVVCACIGFLIGRAKGWGLDGAIWGAILGPLGWLIVLVKPKKG